MRIANGRMGMRITMTDADKELLLGGGKKTGVYIAYNGLGNPEDFLSFSHEPLPNSRHQKIVSAGGSSGAAGHPWLIMLQHRYHKRLDKLQLFGPEEVTLTKDESHRGGGWIVNRPSMSIPYSERVFKNSKATKAAQKHAPVAVAHAAPPTAIIDLKTALRVINEQKAIMGDDLVLEITKEGRLKALIEL